MEDVHELGTLEEFEEELDHLIVRNKLKIGHALLLRNQLERQQDAMRGHSRGAMPIITERSVSEIDIVSPKESISEPPISASGTIGKDGYEYLKWPVEGEQQWYRAPGTVGGWKKWQD
jgi:hypothetical protein